MMLRHDPNVLNQFKYDGERGRRACVPICLLAIYHLAEEIADRNNSQCTSILNDTQWSLVMERGIRLWHLWKANEKRGELFPEIEEILAMPQVCGFYKLFKKEEDVNERDLSGLALQSRHIDNPQGSLYALCQSMLAKRVNVYAVIVLPMCASAFSLLCLKDSRFFLFDPHGAVESGDRVTLLEFRSAKDVVRYLIERYEIENIDRHVNEFGVNYDETEIMEMYSYSASVFITSQ